MLYRDDWKEVFNGRRNIRVNEPKPIYGDIAGTYTNQYLPGIKIIKTTTGIYYYRYENNTQPSTHGWNYLHEYFKVASDGTTLISEQEIINIKYEIFKHLLEIKYLLKENRFKDISIAVSDFKIYYLNKLAAVTKGLQLNNFWDEIY